MGKPIIEVRDLSKSYRLGVIGATSLKDEVSRAWARLRGTATSTVNRVQLADRDGHRVDGETFWALRDVSFDVQPGEALGVIGRNGAGKSTLLKILSRITQQTSGEVTLRGRVASLLEVGTGFHPDLTGRENIFLNGAILGMTKAEIRKKFDEIVAFAEIEQFIDTPVKRYSSGMYVRLAFAVAAHLEPEILLVDEVLAVGDHAFQKKCMGKMQDVTRDSGRTILFVSHNMGAINTLTSTALYLDRGGVVGFGPTAQTVNSYMTDHCCKSGVWIAQSRTGTPLQIVEVRTTDTEGNTQDVFDPEPGFTVEIHYEVREPLRNALVEFFIFSADGVHLLTSGDHDAAPERYERRMPGFYKARVKVPGNLFNLGTYLLCINSGTHHETFDSEEVISFRIAESQRMSTRSNRRGLLVPMLPWQTAVSYLTDPEQPEHESQEDR
jgi:lipopolysaccharide transport system ATP-binding protein